MKVEIGEGEEPDSRFSQEMSKNTQNPTIQVPTTASPLSPSLFCPKDPVPRKPRLFVHSWRCSLQTSCSRLEGMWSGAQAVEARSQRKAPLLCRAISLPTPSLPLPMPTRGAEDQAIRMFSPPENPSGAITGIARPGPGQLLRTPC